MKRFYLRRHPFPFRQFRFPYPSESAVLLTLAISVGLATGTGIWVFTTAVDGFSHLFREQLANNILHPWLGSFSIVPILALAGLVVGTVMHRFVGEERHHGVAGVIEAVALGGGRLRYRRILYIVKFFGTEAE